MSLAWQNLSVRGRGSRNQKVYAPTVGSILSAPFNALRRKNRSGYREDSKQPVQTDEKLKKGESYLLHDFNGTLKAGEMMLVLVSVCDITMKQTCL